MKKLAIISAIILGLGTTSCDSYLDINQDPNSPAEKDVTSSMLLPAAEMNLADSYGNYLRIVGGYLSEHYAQYFGTSNYIDYSQFQMKATRPSSCYQQLNSRALKSLESIRQKSETAEDWGSYLAATTLRAFIYQALVDAFGELPYTEAMDASIPQPKYDEGNVIYAGILKELDDALAKVSPTDAVAQNFLFPGENATAWIQFAKALKLKILTRESGVVSEANSQIAALVSENDFPAGDVAFAGCWANEQYQANPFYSEELSPWKSQDNVIANLAIVGTMQTSAYTDPRLAAWFKPNDKGEYTGGISGTNFSTSTAYKAAYWCRPSDTYNTPVQLLSRAEVEFFIAEYYAKQNNAAQAQSHYNAAIEASFATAGVSGAEGYIAQRPYNQSNWKECIGISKWIALAGINGYEAWCEMRRLDYPAFSETNDKAFYDGEKDASYTPDAYKPGTLYTPYMVDGGVGPGKLLERWPYAESSSARNSNTPEFKGFLTPIFWAAN